MQLYLHVYISTEGVHRSGMPVSVSRKTSVLNIEHVDQVTKYPSVYSGMGFYYLWRAGLGIGILLVTYIISVTILKLSCCSIDKA